MRWIPYKMFSGKKIDIKEQKLVIVWAEAVSIYILLTSGISMCGPTVKGQACIV